MPSADSVIERLQQGNARFVDKKVINSCNRVSPEDVAGAQQPLAIVLSCADSRVPPEIIFDQSLGDLFVIRVAGSIALPSQVGSIEFALESFACPLILVLGHSDCGGVKAALSATDVIASDGLSAIVDTIKKNLSKAQIVASNNVVSDEQMHQAVVENVRQTIVSLSAQSSIIADRVLQKQCRVIGANYDLHSGLTEFFI